MNTKLKFSSKKPLNAFKYRKKSAKILMSKIDLFLVFYLTLNNLIDDCVCRDHSLWFSFQLNYHVKMRWRLNVVILYWMMAVRECVVKQFRPRKSNEFCQPIITFNTRKLSRWTLNKKKEVIARSFNLFGICIVKLGNIFRAYIDQT